MTGRSGGSGQRTRRERPSNGRRARDRSWADDSQGLHFPLEELARLAERRQTDDRHFELERQDEGLVMLCMLVEEKAGRRAPKTRKRKPKARGIFGLARRWAPCFRPGHFRAFCIWLVDPLAHHRSHFGSRYTSGCCGHASLLYPGSTPTARLLL